MTYYTDMNDMGYNQHLQVNKGLFSPKNNKNRPGTEFLLTYRMSLIKCPVNSMTVYHNIMKLNNEQSGLEILNL